LEDTDVTAKESLLAREDSFTEIHQNILLSLENVDLVLTDHLVQITFNSKNPDPIELMLEKKAEIYRVSYWDGYAVNEYYDYASISKAIKKLNKFSIKAVENISKFGIK